MKQWVGFDVLALAWTVIVIFKTLISFYNFVFASTLKIQDTHAVIFKINNM